jgi:predicted amidohydrolase
MKLNLALAQINTVLGDVNRNLEKHLELIKEARNKGADLIIFPELSLTGYILQDLVPTVALHPDDSDPVFNQLLEASRAIDIMVGFVEEDSRNRFFIASAYLSDGKVLHVYICPRMGCSTKDVSLPKATVLTLLTPALDGWAC